MCSKLRGNNIYATSCDILCAMHENIMLIVEKNNILDFYVLFLRKGNSTEHPS